LPSYLTFKFYYLLKQFQYL